MITTIKQKRSNLHDTKIEVNIDFNKIERKKNLKLI